LWWAGGLLSYLENLVMGEVLYILSTVAALSVDFDHRCQHGVILCCQAYLLKYNVICD
jgi:hypothetical protein